VKSLQLILLMISKTVVALKTKTVFSRNCISGCVGLSKFDGVHDTEEDFKIYQQLNLF
jgi:hypothetical protein